MISRREFFRRLGGAVTVVAAVPYLPKTPDLQFHPDAFSLVMAPLDQSGFADLLQKNGSSDQVWS